MNEIPQVFEQNANRVFLIDSVSDRSFTYSESYACITDLALTMQNVGIKRGDRVAIVLLNSPEFVFLYFACLFLGAVAVPINPALHKRELLFLLKSSKPSAIVYSAFTEGLLSEALEKEDLVSKLCLGSATGNTQFKNAHHWSLDSQQARSQDNWFPADGPNPTDLFSITFTSGTTALPKGVTHTVSSIFKAARAFNEELGIHADSRFYHVFPMSYMAGFLNTLICPFTAGASVVIGPAFDAKLALTFWQAPIRYSVNTLWLVPTMLSSLSVDRLATGRSYCRDKIETICVGTAPLAERTKLDFEAKYSISVYESYGLSELLFVASNSRRTTNEPGSVGKLLAGVEIKVLADDGAELPAGQTGDIWIKTPFAFAGYFDYETLRPDPFHPDSWFESGDIGYIDEQLRLHITGRKKDLIIRGGINVSPRAIEEIMLKHEAVHEVAVVGLPHHFHGEEVAAAIRPKQPCEWRSLENDLRKLCQANLAQVEIPTQFFCVEELPKNTTGKVQKAQLREQLVLNSTIAGKC
ncbi:MAG TPA: class I adenylate-forming enzyme family protein [Oculatellaceae cyanobacterium]